MFKEQSLKLMQTQTIKMIKYMKNHKAVTKKINDEERGGGKTCSYKCQAVNSWESTQSVGNFMLISFSGSYIVKSPEVKVYEYSLNQS